MTLAIDSLHLRDFRNHRRFDREGMGRLCAFVGQNAAGKTNVLEAIGLLTALSSFRGARAGDLVREGAASCEVRATLRDDVRNLDLRFTVDGGRKRYELNGKPKRLADLKGLLPAVTFTPDDLQLVKGSHSLRRRELDEVGSQLSRNHCIIRRDYENVLKAKNRLLREEADPLLIESTNEVLVTCGAQLSCYRSALVRRMEPYLAEAYAKMAGAAESLTVAFVPSWSVDEGDDACGCEGEGARIAPFGTGMCAGGEPLTRDGAREALRAALQREFARERAAKRALVGPHRDRLAIMLDGRDATSFASQGQQRSIVLSLKMAELLLIRDMLNVEPVLLLDDVMSELDETRRREFVSLMRRGSQVFVSATGLECFDAPMRADMDVIRLPMEVRA